MIQLKQPPPGRPRSGFLKSKLINFPVCVGIGIKQTQGFSIGSQSTALKMNFLTTSWKAQKRILFLHRHYMLVAV